MNTITIRHSTSVTFVILNNKGINNVNSISYNIKKTHNIGKFKLIWIFNSVLALNPHS